MYSGEYRVPEASPEDWRLTVPAGWLPSTTLLQVDQSGGVPTHRSVRVSFRYWPWPTLTNCPGRTTRTSGVAAVEPLAAALAGAAAGAAAWAAAGAAARAAAGWAAAWAGAAAACAAAAPTVAVAARATADARVRSVIM